MSLQTISHPAFGGVPIRMEETYIPDDPEGQVAATIKLMQRYVLEDATSPAVVHDALEAVGGDVAAETLTDRQKAEAVFRYVKSRLTFVEDETLTNGFGSHNPNAPIVEALIRPADMAVMCDGVGCRRVGDCDDFSMYTAALLRSLGLRTAFVTVAADSSNPGLFSHVYVAAYTKDGQRLALDCSHGAYLGWETEQATRIKEWPIDIMDPATLVLAGLLAYVVARAAGVID